MPTYSYRCHGCGVEFDIQQAFSDSALTTCDTCGGHFGNSSAQSG
jgi:putative FmdB family regulatory protein